MFNFSSSEKYFSPLFFRSKRGRPGNEAIHPLPHPLQLLHPPPPPPPSLPIQFKDHEGSNVSLHSPDRGSEEEDVSEESDQKPAGGVCSDIGFDSATDLRTADSSTLLRYRRGMTAPPPSPADGPGKPVKKTIGFNIATDPPHKVTKEILRLIPRPSILACGGPGM